MKVNLQPLEDTEKSERGKTIVYLAGASALLFEAFKSSGESVGRFQIPSGGQVTLLDTFDKLRIKNMGGVYTESEILIVEGEYARLSDVSLVQIQGITNTISAQITNQLSAAIVGEVNIREIVEELNVRPITETLDIRPITETLDIRPITETLKSRPESGATFAANEFVIGAGLSVSLSAKPLRKELLILAGDSNANDIVINGLAIQAGDAFSLDNFGGSLTITGAEGDSLKVCEVLYAA